MLGGSVHGVQGVPVRVEVGPRDVQQGTCVVSRRDQPGKQGKQFGVPMEPQPFVGHVQALLQEIQDSLYADVSGCDHVLLCITRITSCIGSDVFV